jgi:hypothetical protein
MPAGRPSEYNQEILDKAQDYLVNYKSEYGHMVPSVVGLAKVLNKNQDTLYEWAKHEDKKAFSDTLAKIKGLQHLDLINGGLANELNPTITKLMLANHGYSEKTQQEISGPDGGPIQTDNKWQIEFVNAETDDTQET